MTLSETTLAMSPASGCRRLIRLTPTHTLESSFSKINRIKQNQL